VNAFGAKKPLDVRVYTTAREYGEAKENDEGKDDKNKVMPTDVPEDSEDFDEDVEDEDDTSEDDTSEDDTSEDEETS
jgi:hypothetical protein